TLTLPLDKQAFEGAMIIPITFEWKNFKGETFPVDVRITKEGLNIKGYGEIVPCAFFSTSFLAGTPTESASRFSELSKKKRERSVIEAVKQHYPYVEDLSVETTGGITMLYAAIRSLPEKVPLGIVSGGVNKLVTLLVALANYSQGVVLIDELENGFYHAMLPQVWCSLLQFCKEHDTQIYAATHSSEFLRSVVPCIHGNEEEFCLIRTEKENNQCVPRIFGGRQLESAIEQEVEVR
ncbi:MAG: AAA family ATPase, partial [Nitrososphaera sp.]